MPLLVPYLLVGLEPFHDGALVRVELRSPPCLLRHRLAEVVHADVLPYRPVFRLNTCLERRETARSLPVLAYGSQRPFPGFPGMYRNAGIAVFYAPPMAAIPEKEILRATSASKTDLCIILFPSGHLNVLYNL